MLILSKLSILKKQIKIYFRLHKNYQRFVKKKSFYFFIFTMPIFGYFFSLILKTILLTKSKFLKKILFHKIFLTSIRYINPKQRLKVSKILPDYNNYDEKIDFKNYLGTKKLDTIHKELIEDGVSDIGIIFSKHECESFIDHLKNKMCFDSQVQMQSSGVPYYFDANKKEFNDQKISYFTFGSDTNMTFEPLNNFLKNENLIKLVNTYLGFQSSIYVNSTWYNQACNKSHYVHRLHRDYDDFKFLGITIYWNDVKEQNAPLGFVKKSHTNPDIVEPVSILTGSAGTVLITDTFALHKGFPALKKRYTSSIRFGKPFNAATIINGFLKS